MKLIMHATVVTVIGDLYVQRTFLDFDEKHKNINGTKSRRHINLASYWKT